MSFVLIDAIKSSDQLKVVKSTPIHSIHGTTNLGNQAASSDQNRAMVRSFTRMVVVSLFINIFGQLPYSICFIVNNTGVNNTAYAIANAYANFLLLLMPGLDLLFYFLFNKLFRSVILDFFKYVRSKFIS